MCDPCLYGKWPNFIEITHEKHLEDKIIEELKIQNVNFLA